MFFQLISGLYLTSQSCPRNISILFKSITAAFSCFLCLLISIFRDAILVTSLFFILSTLKTSKEKFIGFVWILLSLTSCSLISVYVHLESTSTLTFRFLLFFVFTFAHMFNFLSTLLYQFRITYLFWEFMREISCTMPTQDLLQNPVSFFSHHYLHYPILFESFISLLTVFLYSLWQYISLYHIWSIF